jgi:hypothetical protein
MFLHPADDRGRKYRSSAVALRSIPRDLGTFLGGVIQMSQVLSRPAVVERPCSALDGRRRQSFVAEIPCEVVVCLLHQDAGGSDSTRAK